MRFLSYDPNTFGILGMGDVFPDSQGPNQADVPEGYKNDERILWKYNPTSEVVEMKTGQELIDAQEALAELPENKKKKWKSKYKPLAKKFKNHTANDDDRDRAIKLLLFTVGGLYDEDDEPDE